MESLNWWSLLWLIPVCVIIAAVLNYRWNRSVVERLIHERIYDSESKFPIQTDTLVPLRRETEAVFSIGVRFLETLPIPTREVFKRAESGAYYEEEVLIPIFNRFRRVIVCINPAGRDNAKIVVGERGPLVWSYGSADVWVQSGQNEEMIERVKIPQTVVIEGFKYDLEIAGVEIMPTITED